MPSFNTLKCEAKRINGNAVVSAYRLSLLLWGITLLLSLVNRYMNRAALAEQLRTMTSLTELPAGYSAALDSFFAAAQTGPTFPPAVVTFVGVFVFLFTFVLNAGYTIYLMGVRRGEQMGYGTLFDGFAYAGKIIVLELLRFLLVLAWPMLAAATGAAFGLLLTLPGIFLSYCFFFALYDLLDDPGLSVMDALKLSFRQTRGHRAELFLLDLSFLIWDLLSLLTAGLSSVYSRPYIEQTRLGYYYAVKTAQPPLPDDTSGENDDTP